MQPQASVIIPMRNAERFIGAALDSILCEKAAVIEAIVVDDKSSDGSVEVVLSRGDPRVRLVSGPGQGISAALNAGLAAAQGSVVMRCDADDVYAPGRIRRQLQWLDAHPAYGAVCGGFWSMDERGRSIAELPSGRSALDITAELLTGHTRTTLGAFAIRAEVARKLGGFRPYFVTAEDLDFQLRLAEVTAVMYLPEQCYGYRLHGDSITHTQNRETRIYYANRALALQRERRDDKMHYLPHVGGVDAGEHTNAEDHILALISGAAWAAHAEGDKARAIRIGLRALRYERLSYRVWRDLGALVLKPAR